MANPALDALLDTLEAPQRAAIATLKLALDCYNNADGTGLFTGMERYAVLSGRVEICAAQANSLTRFWALLLKRMQWGVPPKAVDGRVLDVLSAPDVADVLRSLAEETASLISLARMAHDADKSARRALREAAQTAGEPLPNDPVDFS